jgi:two-component system, cell cycle response regulator DivK
MLKSVRRLNSDGALATYMSTILLIEDNEMNRDMLSRRLARRGYRIVTAESGELGISQAHLEVPDLILMDITLPQMDGWETTRRLKADKSTRHIPIIALTACVLTTDKTRAFEIGCADYDTKPIDFGRLTEKIGTILGDR